MLARPAGDSTGSDKPQRLRISSGLATQRTRMRDSVKKKAPHRRKEELPPLVVVPTHAGNAGPSSYRSVVRINYMDNSLGKVKKAHRTRAVIMHSNSQLTDCFVSLALRRAAHDCITGDGSSGAALRLC